VCFLALVMEATLARQLKEQGTPGSYQEVLADLEQVRAVRFRDPRQGLAVAQRAPWHGL
jgi:hypothetical protein